MIQPEEAARVAAALSSDNDDDDDDEAVTAGEAGAGPTAPVAQTRLPLTGQAEQIVDPRDEANEPLGQGWHDAQPGAPAKKPLGQSTQTKPVCAPITERARDTPARPAGQAEHDDDCTPLPWPGKQEEQELKPTPLKLPEGHALQEVKPRGEKVPEGHSTHKAVPLRIEVICPAPQPPPPDPE